MAALDDIATLDELKLNIKDLNELIDRIKPSDSIKPGDSSIRERYTKIKEMVDSYNDLVKKALRNRLWPGEKLTAEIAFAAVAEEAAGDAHIALEEAIKEVEKSKEKEKRLNASNNTSYEINQAALRTRDWEANVQPLSEALKEARKEADDAAKLRAANTEEMVTLRMEEANRLSWAAEEAAKEANRLRW